MYGRFYAKKNKHFIGIELGQQIISTSVSKALTWPNFFQLKAEFHGICDHHYVPFTGYLWAFINIQEEQRKPAFLEVIFIHTQLY